MNYLAQENSLYLRQHADNPVDWHPWNEQALAKAKQANKPILLSIGYSACHWCHVMAQESFADVATAKVMNEHFINIKVDREERPDLDKVYQQAHYFLTQRAGGWPLTVFLDPISHIPFFAGTYFPVTSKYGLPAFKDLLLKIADHFRHNKTAIKEHSAQLQAALQHAIPIEENTPLSTEILDKAYHELVEQSDNVNGGFGGAPKFPHPTNLNYLLRYWFRTKQQNALDIVNHTLTQMAYGGIYDQLGGGFYRYSVDASWEIPHFEKMLYDNAQLLVCYAKIHAIKKENLFLTIINETANWVLREMQSPEGGFYSTLDADSEHVEGKFYYWDKNEIRHLLTKEEYSAVEKYFGLDKTPNVEHRYWHLHVAQNSNFITEQLGHNKNTISNLLKSAKNKLLVARESRVRPGRDEKIITAWNALIIKGLALAGLHAKQENLVRAAFEGLDFIKSKLWLNKKLFAIYQNGKAQQPAYLDDYAFLLDTIVTLLQIKWRTEDVYFAIDIAETLLIHFDDKEQGGFFFTSDEHDVLIQRPKPFMDEAIPAGNGIAALALLHLGHLLGETRYLNAAEKTLQAASAPLMHYPSVHCSLLDALETQLYPPQIIILYGDLLTIKLWRQACQKDFNPHQLVFAIEKCKLPLPGILNQHKVLPDKTVAYVCQGTQCSPPIYELHELENYCK